jgi:hypothetical protein
MRVYLSPLVLVIDEMGYPPMDVLGATIFFQLVIGRYERGSIILTSNKSYAEWGGVFRDTIIATAILDRLLHHSTTTNIRGESYRLKDRRRAGLPTSIHAKQEGGGEDSTGIVGKFQLALTGDCGGVRWRQMQRRCRASRMGGEMLRSSGDAGSGAVIEVAPPSWAAAAGLGGGSEAAP